MIYMYLVLNVGFINLCNFTMTKGTFSIDSLKVDSHFQSSAQPMARQFSLLTILDIVFTILHVEEWRTGTVHRHVQMDAIQETQQTISVVIAEMYEELHRT